MFFIRSSGANGAPFSIPIDASTPSVLASVASVGSRWMTMFIRWKSD
jgi:hypothetical protein